MIRKRNFIEVIISIIGIESRKAAIAGLHAGKPLCRPFYTFAISVWISLMQGPCHSSGVIQIRVMRISVLESPTPACQAWMILLPISRCIEYLVGNQPIKSLSDGSLIKARILLQCEGRQDSVPYGCSAWLT